MTRTWLLNSAFDAGAAGGIAVAIAGMTVLSLVTLGLLYAGLSLFGPINDLINAISGLLSAVLVWQVHALLRERAPLIATLLLLLAWAGAAAIIGNSLLVAFGRMHWMTGGMFTALGYALLGIWLLGAIRLLAPQPFLSPALVRLGTVAGIGMLFGLVAGPLLFFRVSLTGHPLITVSFIGAAAAWLLYPVWCWLVGRNLLAS